MVLPQFIPQSTIATASPRVSARVAWLRTNPPVDRAWQSTLKFLSQNPQSLEVTAFFLSQFTPKDIDDLIHSKHPQLAQDWGPKELRQLKQELGMFAPIRLAELCGAGNVETFRRGRDAQPRKIEPLGYGNHLNAKNYTPHRLTEEGYQTLCTHLSMSDRPQKGMRHTLSFQGSYAELVREERHLAALLYHLLQSQRNLNTFVELVSHTEGAHHGDPSCGLFFEFAMLRDLWATRMDDEKARAFILDTLAPAPDWLSTCSIEDFNRYWGATPCSKTTIQMPSKWSIQKSEIAEDDTDLFLRSCFFKWSFNAKPDLVLCTSQGKAVCIELKLESDVGVYPSSQADKRVFAQRGLKAVRQTDVQHYLMETLLDYETTFCLISHKGTEEVEGYQTLSWSEVLKALDCSHLSASARTTFRTRLGDELIC